MLRTVGRVEADVLPKPKGIDVSNYDKISELYIAWREHTAYNECIQFEGDTCGECDQIGDEIHALEIEDMKANEAKDNALTPVPQSSQGDQTRFCSTCGYNYTPGEPCLCQSDESPKYVETPCDVCGDTGSEWSQCLCALPF